MISTIIQRLKYKNKKFENEKTTSDEIKHIRFSDRGDFLLMMIDDYISIADYSSEVDLNDKFGISDLVSNSVLWNSRKQKVNKGRFYVIKVNNRLYNFMINDSKIKIDEREKTDKITEERILTFDVDNSNYRYTIFKHDEAGSTIYTKYYNLGLSLGKLDLTLDDTYQEVMLLIERLEGIREIESVLDIEMLRRVILADLEYKVYQKKK